MVAPKTTNRLIESYIAEGRGFGHGENYLAFLQLRRWNASPVSVQTLGRVPPFKRKMHFLSRSEWLLAILFAWVGAHVREQFPLWPWSHNHPMFGLSRELDESLRWSTGTYALCAEAGIKHGTFIGTNIPYIWTMDLVLTLAWLPVEQLTCALASIKPLQSEAYTGDIDPISRGPEKLEVERRYASELSLPYLVADRSRYPGDLLGQLELYSGAALIPPEHRAARRLREFLQCHGDALPSIPPVEWKQRLLRDYKLLPAEADYLVHHIFWHQYIDVDLTHQCHMDRLVRPGGRALKEAIRQDLLRRPQ